MAKTFRLSYDDTPKSLNAGGVGSRHHWGGAYKEKRRWEGIWLTLLLAQRVPKGMAKVYVDARLEWPDARRRDSENYRPALAKALGDCLVVAGYIADDTGDFFELGRVKVISGADAPKQGRTVLHVEAEYPVPA